MLLRIASLSKKGGRMSNEDACDLLFKEGIYCCVLSDGLGGHHGGEVASGIVVDHVIDRFNEISECSKLAINKLLCAANNAISREQLIDSQLKNMCATAVVLIIDTIKKRAIWGHSGDSRLYCFRKNKIIAQTRDHSISQNMVDAGYLHPNELRTSPIRNQLYAALGYGDFRVDILSADFPIVDRDVFLMCSDGLWEYIEETEMESMLSKSHSVTEWLEVMERVVLLRGNKMQDNYSAIAIWCDDHEEITLFL